MSAAERETDAGLAVTPVLTRSAPWAIHWARVQRAVMAGWAGGSAALMALVSSVWVKSALVWS